MKILNITIKHNRGTLYFDRGLTNVVKFLCCLLVASSHYAQDYIHRIGEYNILLDILAKQGGYFGVSIFFFLSGYGLMTSFLKKPITIKEFFKKRLFKVFVPAAFVSIIWIVFLCVFPQIPQQDLGLNHIINWSTILESLLCIALFCFADSVLWFIEIIILLYIVIFIYNEIRISKFGYLKIPTLIIMTILSTLFTYYIVAPFASVSVFAFTIGVLVSEYNRPLLQNVNKICSISIVTILLVSFVLKDHSIILHGMFNYFIIAGWIWLSAFFIIKLDNISPLLSDLSYDIYITHKKVLVITTAFVPSINLIFFLVVALAVAIGEYFVRNTITRWL